MKKEKLYDPEKVGSFRMMFGFKQPDKYLPKKWVKVERTKKENNENKR